MGIPVLWAITREEFIKEPKFGKPIYIEVDDK